MTRIFIILCSILLASCGPGLKGKRSVYNNYQFDKQVIEKIPVYDSLAHALIGNFPSLKQHIKGDDSYRSYKYMIFSDSADLFKKLPPEGALKINEYFSQLGRHFINGFDLFKDSSIKFFIRSSISVKDQLEIRENLSYYPSGTNIKRREFPVKDTMLNKNWQYWIEFFGRDPF